MIRNTYVSLIQEDKSFHPFIAGASPDFFTEVPFTKHYPSHIIISREVIMPLIFLSIVMFVLICPVGCTSIPPQPEPPLSVVPHVDLRRYTGTWYEIASFPNRFQKGCVATKATYGLREDGKISVLNECRRKSLDGKLSTVSGKAKIADTTTNAKLKVTFFWPFYGDYWIIDLGTDYEYAVVGHPDRTYLWILSRTPTMDEALYRQILDRLTKEKAYDVNKLVKTVQPDR